VGDSTRNVRLPPLAAIQAFEAAARLGSFDRASEELCVTASAVGKRVAMLEDRLGVVLFLRAARGLQLSGPGREYLEQVRAALGLLSEVPLHHRASRHIERLRVSAPPTFARQILVPYLAQFASREGGIELEIVLSIPYVDLSAPDADLEIRFGKGKYEGLIATRLVDEQVFPVCAPWYAAQVGGLDTPADLARASLLRSPLEPWKPWFERAELPWPEPSSGTKLVDLGLMLEAAVNGLGVALARASLAHAWLDAGTLVRLFDIAATPCSFYYLCHDAARPLDGARRVFADWITTLCENLQHAPERDSGVAGTKLRAKEHRSA